MAAASATATATAAVAVAVPRGVAALRAWRPPVPFEVRPYPYIPGGGTSASSSALGVSEHAVVKTLLFQEAEEARPLVLLQHGDASVDTKKLIKELARTRGMHSGGDEGSPLRSAPDLAASPTPPSAAASGGKKSKSRAFLCPHDVAEAASGYQIGGTSPFGLLDPSLRVLMEESLLQLEPAELPTEGAAAGAAAEATPSSTALPTEEEHRKVYREEVKQWREARAQASTQPNSAPSASSASSPSPSPSLSSITPAWILINGGARGTLVALSVRSLVSVLQPIPVRVAKGGAASAAPASSPPANGVGVSGGEKAAATEGAKKAGGEKQQA